MSVSAFVGNWGSGKTLALAEMGERYRLHGFEVSSNFGFVNGLHLSTLGEVLDYCCAPIVMVNGRPKKRLLLLDEAGALFPARDYRNFSDALNVLWLQGRKLGLEVAYSVQDFELVDANVRRVTADVIRCRGFFPKVVSERGEIPVERRPRLFLRAYYRANPGKTDEPLKREWRWFDQKVADLYDTYFLVESAQRMISEYREERKTNA